MSVVLAFCGGIASGKSTLSRAVAECLGWARVSFGEHVGRLAVARGVDPGDLLALQDLGDLLAREQPEALCQAVMLKANWSPLDSIILDGLRHIHVFDVLSRLVAPARVAVVFVDAPRDIRAGRLRRRHPFGPTLETLEGHPVEADVLGKLMAQADLRVSGAGDPDSAVRYVTAWVQDLSTDMVVRADARTRYAPPNEGSSMYELLQ